MRKKKGYTAKFNPEAAALAAKAAAEEKGETMRTNIVMEEPLVYAAQKITFA